MAQRIEEFIVRVRAWLLMQAVMLCHDKTDAEDLVQETCLRFIQSFSKLEALPPEHVCEGWLITTMTNRFYDQCRKRRVAKRREEDPALESISVAQPGAKTRLESITDDQFASALESLTPLQRATFELYAAGKSYKEIAELQGIPTGTVGKRLSDARTRLKELLAPLAQMGEH